MGHLTLIIKWRPHDKQGHAIKHPDALVTCFTIGFTCVLAGEQVAVEKPLQIGKVNAMILQIPPPLTLVPGVHVGSVYARCICGKNSWPNALYGRPRWYKMS